MLRVLVGGVRFVQIHRRLRVQNTDTWDAHICLNENNSQHAAETEELI